MAVDKPVGVFAISMKMPNVYIHIHDIHTYIYTYIHIHIYIYICIYVICPMVNCYLQVCLRDLRRNGACVLDSEPRTLFPFSFVPADRISRQVRGYMLTRVSSKAIRRCTSLIVSCMRDVSLSLFSRVSPRYFHARGSCASLFSLSVLVPFHFSLVFSLSVLRVLFSLLLPVTMVLIVFLSLFRISSLCVVYKVGGRRSLIYI